MANNIEHALKFVSPLNKKVDMTSAFSFYLYSYFIAVTLYAGRYPERRPIYLRGLFGK